MERDFVLDMGWAWIISGATDLIFLITDILTCTDFEDSCVSLSRCLILLYVLVPFLTALFVRGFITQFSFIISIYN
jgi:hypothetical protein